MLSEKDIMELVREYANSPEGKQQIKETCGVEYEEKVDEAKLRKYGEKMKEILFRHINPVIDSISPNDIVVGNLKKTDDGYRMEISFRENSLYRESLYVDGYYGNEQLQNIVLLFAKGYHARDYVYGYWVKPGKNIDVGQMSIRSRKDREPNSFLEEAVKEFNQTANGYAEAILDEKYKQE